MTPSPARGLPAILEQVVRAYMARRGLKLRHIGESVAELHERFTGPVEWAGSDYMARGPLRRAYAVYYTPVNALRLAAILGEMAAYTGSYLEGDLAVVDFGCGPGAGLLGLMGALGTRARAIRYTGVDQIRAVREELGLLEEIARAVVAPRAVVQTRFTTELPRARARLGLIMNVLAELGSPVPAVEEFLDRCVGEEGYAIVMEPALKRTTQELQRLRDDLVAAGWRIAAPCPEQVRCPMRLCDDLWCHADVPWEGMRIVEEIDRRVGLRKESLKFSYLVVTRRGHTLEQRFGPVARMVSARHVEKGKTWAQICGPAPELVRVELLTRFRGPQTREFASGRRGDTFTGVALEERGSVARLTCAFRVARLALPRP